MKLLMCMDCLDIFSLSKELKTCSCGKTSGKYIDDLNAVISGNCKAIGFLNSSFKKAYNEQKRKPVSNFGEEFVAFFIPESAKSVKRV